MVVRYVLLSLIVPIVIYLLGMYWSPVYWYNIVIVPLIIVGWIDVFQKKQTIRRLYPVIGRLRYLFESVRPEVQQYFVESNTNGKPVNREFHSLIYQRAKGDRDTRPFGTIFDVNRVGYEWINHSLSPKNHIDHDLKVKFGGPECTQSNEASALNISAMSYGA